MRGLRVPHRSCLSDGSSWHPVPIGNPPPAQESAKIVYDSRRKRAVLDGGNSAAYPEAGDPPVHGMDAFSLWEFDGTDWIQRFEPGDTRLPVSFQKRRGVTAVWHPIRQTTILFGGFVDVLDTCPYSGVTLDQKRAADRAPQLCHAHPCPLRKDLSIGLLRRRFSSLRQLDALEE